MFNIKALDYLMKKRGSKGKEITYKNIEMAEYLQPYSKISVEEKRKIFQIRNKMTKIENNFQKGGKKIKCFCGEDEEMEHIYNCNLLNENNTIEIRYEEIYENNIFKQIQIMKKFEINLEKRNQIKQFKNDMEKEKTRGEKRMFPCDLFTKDPLNCKKFSYG